MPRPALRMMVLKNITFWISKITKSYTRDKINPIEIVPIAITKRVIDINEEKIIMTTEQIIAFAKKSSGETSRNRKRRTTSTAKRPSLTRHSTS